MTRVSSKIPVITQLYRYKFRFFVENHISANCKTIKENRRKWKLSNSGPHFQTAKFEHQLDKQLVLIVYVSKIQSHYCKSVQFIAIMLVWNNILTSEAWY